MTNIEQLAAHISRNPNAEVAFQFPEIGRVRIHEATQSMRLVVDIFGSAGETRRIFLSAFDEDGQELLPVVTAVIDLYRQAEEIERDLRVWGKLHDVLKRPTSQVEDIVLEAVLLAHKSAREQKVRELNSARTELTLAIESFTGQCIKESA